MGSKFGAKDAASNGSIVGLFAHGLDARANGLTADLAEVLETKSIVRSSVNLNLDQTCRRNDIWERDEGHQDRDFGTVVIETSLQDRDPTRRTS